MNARNWTKVVDAEFVAIENLFLLFT